MLKWETFIFVELAVIFSFFSKFYNVNAVFLVFPTFYDMHSVL